MITTEPTLNEQGDEEHPSFGVAHLNRITCTPPTRLFDSSISHGQYVRLEVSRATRHRSLQTDRIHSQGAPLVSLEMSLSQWGALVSSFGNGTGTPVTLHRVNGEVQPEAAHASRLAETSREVRDAADQATAEVRDAALALVAAYNAKAGRREMNDLINSLSATVRNLPSNMKYAADTLTRHAEDVVSKARADIEAAHQFGNTIVSGAPALELEA